ncbi:MULTISPECIES: DUF402 domain-containing protein [Micrococcaceae]|uniref:DUF402 domain-containing protein n=1 Tax=Micrococcaceae TaxID=1268 RepID=UPI001036815D|nr:MULTISPECIES: DUF402 domain-containing protein [Micrococcaceae]TAP27596.1 DUF402 domain-containing protein [Arthrobacter sp. S41]UXN30734.1 YgaC family protein [Glutamicibacter sp. M10]
MSSVQACPQGLPRTPKVIATGELVVARAWKFDGTPHWVVPGFYLGQDEYGHWLHQPKGSLVARPGVAHLAQSDALCLIPHEGPWIATLYAQPTEDFDVYIDLSHQIGWQAMKSGGWEVNSIDLDLDVIRSRSRGTFLDDEDEFEEHSVAMGYPEQLKTEMSGAARELLDLVATDASPFDRSYRNQWLAKAGDLPTT